MGGVGRGQGALGQRLWLNLKPIQQICVNVHCACKTEIPNLEVLTFQGK